MERTGTPTRPNLFERLKAAISPGAFRPVIQTSVRLPDLETWKMPHRSVDMKDWEVALNMAQNVLNPDRNRLLDLYDSLLVDSHLASAVESRVLRVTRSKFKLVGKDGKPLPDLLPLLQQRWFEDFLRFAAEAPFRGHTLIELGKLNAPGDLREVNRIDQRNVLPWCNLVVRRRGDTTGYNYTDPTLSPYYLEVGRSTDLGVLSQVAPVVIIKKYATGSWEDFAHKFGVPPRYVKTPSPDKGRVKQLETMMQNMVSSAYAVIQGDEEISIMQTPGTDAHKVFDALISRMNSEISKRILGQDGTDSNKDASGTYGSLQILQGVAEDRHQADKSSVLYTINNELFPRLVNMGYPLNGVRFVWDELLDMSPGEMVDAVTKLGTIYNIDPAHVEERTGIRILSARRMPGEEVEGEDPPTDPPTTPPKKKPGNPPGNGKQGKGNPEPSAKLKTEEGEDDDEEDGAWPQDQVKLCGVCGGSTHDIHASATISDQVLEQLLQDIHAGGEWSQEYFEATAAPLTEGLLSTWRHDLATLNYDAPDHVARTMMEQNLFRFGAAKTLAIVTDLNQYVRESKGFADFKRKVDESGKLPVYNRNRLEAEYVNAVNTGMQASRWYQMQGSKDALPNGEYWTQGDAQVRPAHAALDGKIWPLSDTIWNAIWPPNGWKCRCTVLPTAEGPEGELLKLQTREAIDGLDLSGELERMKKGGFAQNKAITGEVFKLNTAYREQLGEAVGKTPTLGIRDSYGPDAAKMAWSELSKGKLPAIDSNTPTVDDAKRWYDRTKNADGVVVMKDYAGRPVRFQEKTLLKKLTKEQERAQLVDQLPNALANPDEVWLDQSGDLVYLKFTQQGLLRVPVAVYLNSGIRIRSFYLDEANVDLQRSGTLVKKYRP